MKPTRPRISRAAVLAFVVSAFAASAASSKVVEYDLVIATQSVNYTGESVEALTVNGGIPGPVLEFTEGDTARIRVRNELDGWSSVHWHGLLLPAAQDGVPGVTFAGIAPHSTFTYEFPIRQAGTYWYHSHSGFQEQRGVYGSIVIHPRGGERHQADHDYVAVLSDWTNESPVRVMGLLKSGNEWFAVKRGTNQSVVGALWRGRIVDFFQREWESMPDNEISDVAYDTLLINGKLDERFAAKPGETVRLRIINASAASYQFVEFAGGPMKVIAADGLDVEPFDIDRLLVAIAETYDVLLTLPSDGAFELRASSRDGSGSVTALLGSGERIAAPAVPQPDYYQNAMNAGYWKAMMRTAWDVEGSVTLYPPGEAPPHTDMADMHAMPGMHDMAGMGETAGMHDAAGMHAMPGMHDMAGMHDADLMDAPDAGGSMPGHEKDPMPSASPPKGHAGMKMAPATPGRPKPPYERLRSTEDTTIAGPRPTRVIELNLTGDMGRYVWSMNGRTLHPDNTIRIHKGERVRFVMSNRTMMSHPMHLHGHFFRVLNGQGARAPLKHTVDVAPMATTVIEFDANEEKDWFFHCHVLYHMAGGMERIVHYEGTEVDAATLKAREKLYAPKWYTFGEVGLLSSMTGGAVQVSSTRHIFEFGWEAGFQEDIYDLTGAYNYYWNRYFQPFVGVNAWKEAPYGDGVRGVLGFSWLLPLNVRTSVWVGTDASFRWQAEKELQITRRLKAFGEVQYDTVTKWEWTAGGEFTINRYAALTGQYSSEYGVGAGFRIYFSAPAF